MNTRLRFTSVAVLMCIAWPTMAAAASKEDERVDNAREIVEQLRIIPERAIPPALLDRAYAVAVIPGMLKIGVALAGRHGKGVMSVRNDNGWSAPVFIKLSGGSIGWQAGLQSSDLVLVFTNKRGVENITSGKLTLGADASIAAGPVGRHGSAATDGRLQAEVYSYSRARGLFAGVSIEGAALRIDKRANAAFYTQPAVSAADILAGNISDLPDPAIQFVRSLPTAASSAAEQVAETVTPPEETPAEKSEPARTFAIED